MTPSMAPSMVSTYREMPTVRTTSSGIMTLLTFSIPFSTPQITTAAAIAVKITNQTMGSDTPEIKPVK